MWALLSSNLKSVNATLKHSYSEIAYDIIPIQSGKLPLPACTRRINLLYFICVPKKRRLPATKPGIPNRMPGFLCPVPIHGTFHDKEVLDEISMGKGV
jgi:hypothetical protein